MENFDEYVLRSLDPASGSGLWIPKETADQFCEQLKVAVDGWAICLEQFLNSPPSRAPQVRFFCLNVIVEQIRNAYGMWSPDDRVRLKMGLLTWLGTGFTEDQLMPNYLKNKLAQILVTLFALEYPHEWGGFFADLASLLPAGPAMHDMYLRVMHMVHEALYPPESAAQDLTPDDRARRNGMKDAMRQGAVQQVIEFLYGILTEALQNGRGGIVEETLKVLAELVVWAEIRLIADDRFVPLLFQMLDFTELRTQACICFKAIISKGMRSAEEKFGLLSALNLCSVFERIDGADSEEYATALAALITAHTNELMEIAKTMPSDATAEALSTSMSHVVRCVGRSEICVSQAAVDCAGGYVQLMHKHGSLVQQDAVEKLLITVSQRSVYPPDFPFEGQQSETAEQSEFAMYRKTLADLFKNVARWSFPTALGFVREALGTILSQLDGVPSEMVEVALHLLVQIKEVEENESPSGPSALDELLISVVCSPVLEKHSTAAVVTTYFTLLVRFHRVMCADATALNSAFTTFITCLRSGLLKGVVANAMLRFMRKTASAVARMCDVSDMLTNLFSLVDMGSVGGLGRSADPMLLIIETIGVLIFATPSPEPRTAYCQAALSPILAHIQGTMDAPAISVAQVSRGIQAVTALVKSLEGKQCEPVQVELKNSLSVVFTALARLSESVEIRTAVIRFVQAVMALLAEEILPVLVSLIPSALASGDAGLLSSTLSLLTQFAQSFGDSAVEFSDELLPAVMGAVADCVGETLLMPPTDMPATHEEAQRELQDVRRAWMQFMKALTVGALIGVFVSARNSGSFVQILSSLSAICRCAGTSINDKRLAVQLFRAFIERFDWSIVPEAFVGADLIPSLQVVARAALEQATSPHRSSAEQNPGERLKQLMEELGGLQAVLVEKGAPAFLPS